MELPNGWTYSNFSELALDGGVFCDGDWVESKDQDPNGEIRLIQLADIGDGIFNNKSKRFLTKEKAIALRCTYLTEGDILIARMPEPLGRACIFPYKQKGKFVTVVDVAILRPNSEIALNKYCNYVINSPQIRVNIASLKSGTTRKRISRKNLDTISVPIPPLAEQRRIVEKIDALFSELDNGLETLRKVKQQLKAYRQAVLKMAFDGKLINSCWNISKLGLLALDIKIGPFGTLLHKADYVVDGIPVINPMHIENYKIKPNKKNSITVEKATELSSYTLFENDIVLGRRGEMGRAAYVSAKESGWLCGTGSMIIRFKKSQNGKLMSYLFAAEQSRKYLTDNCNGTTMSNLNEKILKNMPFPDIPETEQHMLIDAIESRLSVCDKLEQLVDENLEKSEALRQSILKKAFEGCLVPQDPNDEAAEKLLKHIKAQRVKTAQTMLIRRKNNV